MILINTKKAMKCSSTEVQLTTRTIVSWTKLALRKSLKLSTKKSLAENMKTSCLPCSTFVTRLWRPMPLTMVSAETYADNESCGAAHSVPTTTVTGRAEPWVFADATVTASSTRLTPFKTPPWKKISRTTAGLTSGSSIVMLSNFV